MEVSEAMAVSHFTKFKEGDRVKADGFKRFFDAHVAKCVGWQIDLRRAQTAVRLLQSGGGEGLEQKDFVSFLTRNDKKKYEFMKMDERKLFLLEKAWEKFCQFQKNEEGEVEKEHFRTCMSAVDNESFERIWRKVDVDGSNTLGFAEYVIFLVDYTKPQNMNSSSK